MLQKKRGQNKSAKCIFFKKKKEKQYSFGENFVDSEFQDSGFDLMSPLLLTKTRSYYKHPFFWLVYCIPCAGFKKGWPLISQISSTGAYMGGVYKTRLCLVRPQNKYVQKNLFNESKIFIFLQKKTDTQLTWHRNLQYEVLKNLPKNNTYVSQNVDENWVSFFWIRIYFKFSYYLINNPRMSWQSHKEYHDQTKHPTENFISQI